MEHHLVQANVAYARDALDSPRMAGFVRASDHVNRAAEAAPGFVWRLEDTTGLPFQGDDRWVVNVSAWRSMAELEAFTHSDPHRRIMQLRAKWFEPLDRPATACWWAPAGHQPDLAEVHDRMRRLWDEGPTDELFSLGAGVPPGPPAG